MKKSKSADQVMESWLHEEYEATQNYFGNVSYRIQQGLSRMSGVGYDFFADNALYSYRLPIANKCRECGHIYVYGDSSTRTTNRHISTLRSMLRGRNWSEVPSVPVHDSHVEDQRYACLDKILVLLNKAKRARTRTDWYMHQAQGWVNSFNQLNNCCHTKLPELTHPGNTPGMVDFIKSQKKLEAIN